MTPSLLPSLPLRPLYLRSLASGRKNPRKNNTDAKTSIAWLIAPHKGDPRLLHEAVGRGAGRPTRQPNLTPTSPLLPICPEKKHSASSRGLAKALQPSSTADPYRKDRLGLIFLSTDHECRSTSRRPAPCGWHMQTAKAQYNIFAHSTTSGSSSKGHQQGPSAKRLQISSAPLLQA